MQELLNRALAKAYVDSKDTTQDSTVAAVTSRMPSTGTGLIVTADGGVAVTGLPLINPIQYGPVAKAGVSDPGVTPVSSAQSIFVGAILQANNTDHAMFSVSVLNGNTGGVIRLFVGGILGDGDSANAKEYLIAISRIAGAATGATIGTAFGTALNAGVTGDATVTASLGAVSGAVGATQTFPVNVKVARSAGTSTNHQIVVSADLMSGLNGNITLV